MEHSPLNKLPAELRNRISELALFYDRVHVEQSKNSTRFKRSTQEQQPLFAPDQPASKEAYAHTPFPFALAQTCKKLQADNLKLFYSINTFVIKADVPTFSYTVNDFLASLKPEAAGSVQSVVVKCDGTEKDLLNAVGHALFQLQQPCSVRIKLELSYAAEEEWSGRKVMELNSADLKKSLAEAKKKSRELRELEIDVEDTDADSCMALMGKLDLN